jgi:hypothetical protein
MLVKLSDCNDCDNAKLWFVGLISLIVGIWIPNPKTTDLDKPAVPPSSLGTII